MYWAAASNTRSCTTSVKWRGSGVWRGSILPYVATAKNEPARAFIERFLAAMSRRTKKSFTDCPSATLAIAHSTCHDPETVVEARKAEERKGTAPSTKSVSLYRSDRYAALANVLTSDVRVLQATRAEALQSRTLPETAAKPATDIQQSLLDLWQELLGVQGLGVEDDYFALGGTSLIAARLFAEIKRRFGANLP